MGSFISLSSDRTENPKTEISRNSLTITKSSSPFIEDVLYEIFTFIAIDAKFILKCRLVCKQWNNLILNSSKNLFNTINITETIEFNSL